jgi:hypothetical protein
MDKGNTARERPARQRLSFHLHSQRAGGCARPLVRYARQNTARGKHCSYDQRPFEIACDALDTSDERIARRVRDALASGGDRRSGQHEVAGIQLFR